MRDQHSWGKLRGKSRRASMLARWRFRMMAAGWWWPMPARIRLVSLIRARTGSSSSSIEPVSYSAPSPLEAMKQLLLERGLLAPLRGSTLRVYPPLCITEADLHHGLAIMDEALEIADALVPA